MLYNLLTFLDLLPFRLIIEALSVSNLLVVQKNLEVGEVITVDVSCIVAVTSSVNVQIKYNGPIRRAVFGVSCSYY